MQVPSLITEKLSPPYHKTIHEGHHQHMTNYLLQYDIFIKDIVAHRIICEPMGPRTLDSISNIIVFQLSLMLSPSFFLTFCYGVIITFCMRCSILSLFLTFC